MVALAIIAPASAGADLFYWPSEYNTVYFDRAALEIELKALKQQYDNDRANLEAKIREKENAIESLKKTIAMLEQRAEADNRRASAQIADLEKRTDILKKAGSEREKKLIDENRAQQRRHAEQLRQLRDELAGEKEKNIRDVEALKNEYEKRISDLQGRIVALGDDLAELKKLTQRQKEELSRLESQAKELEKQLENEIRNGEIRLKRLHGKLIINIDNRISFDSGSAVLKRDVLAALGKISGILSSYPEYRIVVEGHTDTVPIRTSQFRDNWQLSTERALSVLGYLLRNTKLDRTRFSAAGYGEFHPILPNDTEENRSLNRRVDIVVIPRLKE